ncbi:phenylalanine ammonia-lyase [Bimuria novae-zelandiae CBS 107.79]|uniref:Phenylalanine ammonia-lyase n=1 Tax=Bimuria novae-zelandiae CBS 107.79 TaxID=1447943 RepID=A0A6A5VT46_9PLEO|nr:phenylalanine ammonia-lyase [Bimuria novae-zelandiae CBS 107.79]
MWEVRGGVSTGFGGSADARNQDAAELQRVLIRELHYGILGPSPRETHGSTATLGIDSLDEGSAFSLPKSWTRTAILIRINSLLKGRSAVRPVIVQRMLDLISHDIIPIIPLRGSILASGDLSPLSYIGGAIQGKPSIQVHTTNQTFLHADEAFSRANLDPVTLGAKEGLAVVNGTAISAAAVALAVYDAHTLAVLSQIITAMTVEVLLGTAERFASFFAEVRPHPGQLEVAKNISAFLMDSCMVEANTGADFALRQDRYSMRTAPQWISSIRTDNPLASRHGMLHGGKFQAKAVSSAMEKIKQGNCTLGRILFAQCTEIINPATSRGLPPNLVAEDPGTSFIFKGTDINMAALQAELGFLATPVNHVQTAELGNQSLNSLALIAARYTHTSNEVLGQMAAAHLITLCQALDLRAMRITFFGQFKPDFDQVIVEHLNILARSNEKFRAELWKQLQRSFDDTTSMDHQQRFKSITSTLKSRLVDETSLRGVADPLGHIEAFGDSLAQHLEDAWYKHRDAYIQHGTALPLIGCGSRPMYVFIQERLRIPFLVSDCIRTPSMDHRNSGSRKAPTMGTFTSLLFTSLLYRGIRDGTILEVMLPILQDVQY